METMDNGMDDALTIGGLETLRDGDTLWLAGRYKVVRRLGEGGMGSVWLAEDTKLDGKQFAIKMLPAVFAGKKGAYRQVKQEALMAMKLSHPNIATVRAFEEDEGGAPFLVMDYIEGRGLDEILAEKGPLGEAETRRLLGPVAAALDYAHSQGVVHRDVKPGNVMVRKDGTPFVLDFGIAREIQETMTRVTGKFSSGTLLYMSPEQLRGRAPKPAQDVYSFAAMAYECLTGAPPFSRGQIEYQIVNEAPEPLPADAAAEPLRQGIMAGLAKEPEARPGTCMEVLGNGGASRPGEPVAGTPAGATAGMSSNGGASRPGEPVAGTPAGATAGMPAGKVAGKAAETTARRDGSPHHPEAGEAERARREAEARLEAERAARKRAEEDAREARRKAQAEELEAQRAQESRGRAAGWAWFLAIVLLVGGLAAYGWWQQEQETSQAQVRRLQSEAEAQRKAQAEAEAKWKAAAEAQRRAQEEAERKTAEARQELERQRAEAEVQRLARAEAERKAAAEAEAKAEQERKMKPSILLKSMLDGREVAATVTEGLARSGLTTPVTVNLEVGGSYSFAMEYEEGGRKYAGRRTVMAKDRGVTDAAVVLEEVKEDVAGPTKTITLPGGATMEMVRCPAGSFSMGSPPGETGRDDDETQHRVTLTEGFWMAKTEVTQKQWESVMGDNPSYHKGDNLPVESVSWDECMEFCRKTGLQLPTEAEWEYACRAGTTGDYGGAGDLDTMGWYSGNSGNETHPVGRKQGNAWGLQDMHGNVWEWCADWYDGGYYAKSPGVNPQGPASGVYRVLRGGCYWSDPRLCRSANRSWSDPGYRDGDYGFRPVARQD